LTQLSAELQVNSEEEALLEQGLLEFMELKAANLSAVKGTDAKKVLLSPPPPLPRCCANPETQQFQHFPSQVETQGKKNTVDATNLQLNNLNYEKNHYVKQIRSCRDIKLSHDKLDLVPVAALKAEKGAVDENDKHALMVQRLQFELEQRKSLCSQIDQLKEKKNGLILSNESKSSFLSSLLSKLKGLEDATMPVQEHLGLKTTRAAKEYKDAHHLPRPLYNVFLQAVAFRDASGGKKFSVHIDGDVSAARALASRLAAKEAADAKEEEGKDEDAKEEEEEGRQQSHEEDKDDEDSKFDAVHPLTVRIKVTSDSFDGTKKLVVLRFIFLTQLNVVALESAWADNTPTDNLLVDLWPGNNHHLTDICLLLSSHNFTER